MERNFMSLSQKKVKEEVIEIVDDPVPALQLSFSNQVTSHSQSPPLKAGQEDRPRKTGYDSLSSTGYMTISSTESLTSNKKSYSNMMQRNLSLEKHVGSHYPVANYPSQHYDAHSVQHHHEVRSLSNANRTNTITSASMSIPVQQSIITSSRPNMTITSPVNLKPVEAAPAALGSNSTSVVGNTNLRNNTNIPKAPAQLTIFYSGLVCVYNNISPEKAQAIMLLAGNAPPLTSIPSLTPNSAVPTPSIVQAPIPTPSQVCLAPTFRPSMTPNAAVPDVGLLGHISITPNTTTLTTGLATSTIELASRRSTGISFSHSLVPEAPRLVSSLRHIPPAQPISNSSAVPQARKASLARFLEKRKERATITAPYSITQSPDYRSLGQGSKSFSMNSASSSSLPPIITLQ